MIRRVREHKAKQIPGFSQKYNCTKLIYFEPTNYIEDALKREKQLKNWHRQWKINMITEHNPEWKDLAYDIGIGIDPEITLK